MDMKFITIFILTSCIFMTVQVTAQDDLNTTDYRQQVLDIINNYGDKFDDCFQNLPADFPDVSVDQASLNDRIGELVSERWYHRVLQISPYGQTMHEVFYYMDYGNARYAISIQYFFNNGTKEFTIPYLYFLSDEYGGGTGEFGHIIEGGIPSHVADTSLSQIKACVGVPGFLFISVITTMVIVLMFYSRYKK